MVSVKRAIALLLMTILIMMNATIAYAGEADGTDIQAESREGKEETLEKKKEEEPVELLEQQPLKEAVDEPVAEPAVDVCFYIRGNGIGFDIPKEPASYSSSLYSAPIRVEDSIMQSNLSFSSAEEDGSEDSLLSDGFTASNGVTATISHLPSAEGIRGGVPGYDSEIHYFVW